MDLTETTVCTKTIQQSDRYLKSFSILLAVGLICILGCKTDSRSMLFGRWEGKTKIDQDIAITIRPDSTIEIETQADSSTQIRKGTYQIVDRRLRIALTSLETVTGKTVKRENKADQDEALFTMIGENEMVLRKGTQAIILHRAKSD